MKLDTKQIAASVTTTVAVSNDRVLNLLVSAFEGASNYWIKEISVNPPDGTKYEDFKEGGKYAPDDYYAAYQVIPFVGGSLTIIENSDNTNYLLDRTAIEDGLQRMATKYPRHWQNFITEDDDAETADVFLQLATMGEIVFG